MPRENITQTLGLAVQPEPLPDLSVESLGGDGELNVDTIGDEEVTRAFEPLAQ